jgi:hypothetical protein
MWTVQLECDKHGQPTVEVVNNDMIARLPVYGSSWLPDNFSYHNALDSFNSFFVNYFIDHHAHEFIALL